MENLFNQIKPPQITMNLYETDIATLQTFLQNENEKVFTEEYLILYNFATDCKYTDFIQPELMASLLPYYLKAIEQAVIFKNKIAKDIYWEFNTALFFNQGTFLHAIGNDNFQMIMEYYIKLTIKKMEMQMQNLHLYEWISLFNTTIAFCEDNIRSLFQRIFGGSFKVKYSLFQYLSILLFKESDNLCVKNEAAYWTSDIWKFDGESFFWNDGIIGFFDKEISRERVESLFNEIKPFISAIFEPEICILLCEEMKHSFESGVFYDRKAEFLEKIHAATEKDTYWNNTF